MGRAEPAPARPAPISAQPKGEAGARTDSAVGMNRLRAHTFDNGGIPDRDPKPEQVAVTPPLPILPEEQAVDAIVRARIPYIVRVRRAKGAIAVTFPHRRTTRT